MSDFVHKFDLSFLSLQKMIKKTSTSFSKEVNGVVVSQEKLMVEYEKKVPFRGFRGSIFSFITCFFPQNPLFPCSNRVLT